MKTPGSSGPDGFIESSVLGAITDFVEELSEADDESDLVEAPFETWAEFDAYSDATAGNVIRLAANTTRLLGVIERGQIPPGSLILADEASMISLTTWPPSPASSDTATTPNRSWP